MNYRKTSHYPKSKTIKSRYRWVKYTLKLVLGTAACILVFTLACLLLALEKQPISLPQKHISSAELKQTSKFIRLTSSQIINSRTPVTVSASELELNGLMTIAQKTYPSIQGVSTIDAGTATFRASFPITLAGYTFFTHINTQISGTEDTLVWENTKLGNLPINDGLANLSFRYLVKAIVGDDYGQNILDGVHSVEVEQKHILVVFEPHDNFQKGIAGVTRRLNGYAGRDLPVETDRIQHYLDYLAAFRKKMPNSTMSLAIYLESLLREAQRQSTTLDFAPHLENQSALLALAIQSGPGVFRHFVEDIKVHNLPAPNLTLSGRLDLGKHFIYSSAMKIISDEGISFSIGQMKEILDTDGSGFSFTDITADRAGIQFAQKAVISKESAVKLQAFANRGLKESDFFPRLDGIPDGLTEKEFNQIYQSSTSIKYRSQLHDIDLRIEQTPLQLY